VVPELDPMKLMSFTSVHSSPQNGVVVAIAPGAHLVLVHQRRMGAEIGCAGDVARPQPGGFPVVADERGTLVRVGHHREQALLLQRHELGHRQRLDRVE
jgi:hypothetical protein